MTREDIERDAAQWVSREDRGLTPEEGATLSLWLESTPNRVAYLRLKSAWEESAALAALQNAPEYRTRTALWRHKWPALAAASILLLVAGTSFMVLRHHWATQEVFYATQAGERPTLQLVDGTKIQLDANSRLRATISDAHREVTLEKGEAYFDVTHEADRPFVVVAGRHRISDLGTKFSVLKDGDDIRVVVTEGRVQIDNIDTLSPAKPIFADGGHVVVAKADEMLLTTINPQDLSDDLGWREGRLIFNQVTLAEAAKNFNRYNSEQLVVTGEARNIRIGGSFRADNMDVFVALIRTPLGLNVENRGETVILSKK